MMYVGPETLMPLASALAAVAGVAIMFWRKTVAMVKASFRFVSRLFSRNPPVGQDGD
jgi:hypothetical protein